MKGVLFLTRYKNNESTYRKLPRYYPSSICNVLLHILESWNELLLYTLELPRHNLEPPMQILQDQAGLCIPALKKSLFHILLKTWQILKSLNF